MMSKTYSKTIRLLTFEERFEYLKLKGIVGARIFGHDRYLNQILYKDKRWKSIRDVIIIRDNGCDLGCEDYPIHKGIIVHHINTLSLEDIEEESPRLFDPENLICVSMNTHNAIHYGESGLLPKKPIERYPGDTRLW